MAAAALLRSATPSPIGGAARRARLVVGVIPRQRIVHAAALRRRRAAAAGDEDEDEDGYGDGDRGGGDDGGDISEEGEQEEGRGAEAGDADEPRRRRRGRPPTRKKKAAAVSDRAKVPARGAAGGARRFAAPRYKHHIVTFEEDSRMDRLGREAYNIGARSYRDMSGVTSTTSSSSSTGGYESFVKFCKKHGRSVPERALLRCQRVLKTDLHMGAGDDASGVRVTLTGNGDIHDVEIDAVAGVDDADALSAALTAAAKDAYASSRQSMLALGLDSGASMGYRYPTADMLYPDRFAYLVDGVEGTDGASGGGTAPPAPREAATNDAPDGAGTSTAAAMTRDSASS